MGKRMNIKKTSFPVTESALQFENILLSHMDIPRTIFHRRMIDFYFENNIKLHPYLLIADRKDPNYIKKKAVEQIYLDEERLKKIEAEAERYGCRIGAILFQALISYSVAIAEEVLGPENLAVYFGIGT